MSRTFCVECGLATTMRRNLIMERVSSIEQPSRFVSAWWTQFRIWSITWWLRSLNPFGWSSCSKLLKPKISMRFSSSMRTFSIIAWRIACSASRTSSMSWWKFAICALSSASSLRWVEITYFWLFFSITLLWCKRSPCCTHWNDQIFVFLLSLDFFYTLKSHCSAFSVYNRVCRKLKSISSMPNYRQCSRRTTWAMIIWVMSMFTIRLAMKWWFCAFFTSDFSFAAHYTHLLVFYAQIFAFHHEIMTKTWLFLLHTKTITYFLNLCWIVY